EGRYRDIWIEPAAGDAGGALGAALFVWHQLLGNERQPQGHDAQQGSFLGPRFSGRQVQQFLNGVEAVAHHFPNEEELVQHVAQLLAEEKGVGWFHGRMEFGPRALGARSILGDPRSPRMQATMNLKIKFRESFRPFAPMVLQEHASEWFDFRPDQEGPYMLLVAPVLPKHRLAISAAEA